MRSTMSTLSQEKRQGVQDEMRSEEILRPDAIRDRDYTELATKVYPDFQSQKARIEY